MSIRQFASLGQRWRRALPWLKAGFAGLALGWLVLRQPILGFLLAVFLIVIFAVIILFFERNGAFSLKRVVPALLVLTILFPYIRLPGDIPDIRPEFVIIFVASGLLFLGHFAKGSPIQLRRYPIYKWFGLFAFSIFLSMAYMVLFRGQPIIGRDFWELVKVFLYFLIFAIVASQNITPTNLRRYYKFALLVFVISALFGFLQYFDFASINEVASPYYAPTQMEGLLVQGRITGTMGNPNDFGALMALAASLAFSGGLFLQRGRLRILCWASFILFIFTLGLSQSRSSFIAVSVSVVMQLLFFLLEAKGAIRRRLKRIIISLLMLSLSATFTVHLLPESALWRLTTLQEFTEQASLIARITTWERYFDVYLESPILGWGPGKAVIGFEATRIIDNEWLLLMVRYGVVGLAVFLCLFGNLFFGLSHIRRKLNQDRLVAALTFALQSIFIAYAVYMFPAGVYHNMQLMSLIMLLTGMLYALQYAQGGEYQ